MLQEWKAMEKPEEEEIRVRLAAAKEKLAKQQLLIKEQKIPVLVLMEMCIRDRFLVWTLLICMVAVLPAILHNISVAVYLCIRGH